MEKSVLKIAGMSCQHCQAAVKEALEELPGVSQVEVDLEAGEASVTFSPEAITVEKMKEAVEEAGYEVAAVTK